MGIFSTPNPFDGIIEKVTDAKNTAEDWGHIMDLCDQVQQHKNGAKECLKAIVKRLNHQDPHVVLQAVTVLDACANNCGKEFRLEIASREFENEFRRILGRTQPKVQEKLRGLLKSWAEGEFKGDSQLSLIPSLYQKLKQEGVDFSSTSDDPTSKKRVQQVSKDPNVVSSQQEEDDIAKAIQMSLQETKSSVKGSVAASSNSTLYPSNSLYGSLAAAPGASAGAVGGNGNSSSTGTSSSSSPKKDEKKARALYDFEAAEDNEMTFKAGEIVIILDDSDANWWKGSNHRGEGLFPANFVTPDLKAEPEQFKEQRRRSVQFNEEVEVVTNTAPPTLVEDLSTPEVSEEKIDTVLQLLHEADPTQPESDAPELPGQEDQVYRMGPLIDAELEAVDRRHAQLTRLSTELVDALNLYHQLMHENIQGGYGMPMPNGGYNPYAGPPSLPHQQQPPQFNGYYPQPPNNGVPTMVPPGGYPGPAAPQPQMPPQAPNGNGGAENNQMYAGSAPPPPTPPMPHHDPGKQGGVPPLQQAPPQSHFTPQEAAMASAWLNGAGLPQGPPVGPPVSMGYQPVVSGYQNPPMPQM